MNKLTKLAGLALALSIAAGGAGCKQGAGERCLLDSDCQSGLICGTQDHTCTVMDVVLDAGPPNLGDAPTVFDAPFIPDAPEVVAAARPDARPDAAIPDARPPDAPTP